MSLSDSAQNNWWPTEEMDPWAGWGTSVLSRAVLDEFTPNAYEGTNDFRAIVLSNAIPIPPEANIHIAGLKLVGGGEGSPMAGDPKYAHWACRCRIVERNSPHLSYPTPDSLVDPNWLDVNRIGLHPFFVTKDTLTEVDSPQVGDVVMVTYEKGPEGGRMYKGLILTKPYLTNGAGGGVQVGAGGAGAPLGSFSSVSLNISDEFAGQPLENAKPGSGFGQRKDPFTGKQSGHGGADYPAKTGAGIYAIADGTIARSPTKGCRVGVKSCGSGFGNNVKILHSAGDGKTIYSIYAHMSAVAPGIADGTPVKKGQLIGQVGNTGRSKGSHLHLEVHVDGKKVDPVAYISQNNKAPTPSDEVVADVETAPEDKLDDIGIHTKVDVIGL